MSDAAESKTRIVDQHKLFTTLRTSKDSLPFEIGSQIHLLKTGQIAHRDFQLSVLIMSSLESFSDISCRQLENENFR